jgi:hypothetical protein
VSQVVHTNTEIDLCLDAFRTGRQVSYVDVGGRAGALAAVRALAKSEGFLSVRALPMRVRRQVIGALNPLGHDPVQLPDKDVRVAQAFADIATIAILQERLVPRARGARGAVADRVGQPCGDRTGKGRPRRAAGLRHGHRVLDPPDTRPGGPTDACPTSRARSSRAAGAPTSSRRRPTHRDASGSSSGRIAPAPGLQPVSHDQSAHPRKIEARHLAPWALGSLTFRGP